MQKSSKMRILHLPTPTGGNSWGLAQGEKKIGLESHVLVSSKDWLDYPYDIFIDLDKYKSEIAREFNVLKIILNLKQKYNIFHFNFGSTLLRSTKFFKNEIYLPDLPFYKGRKIIFTYNGCDARQKYKTMERTKFSACHEEDCYNGECRNKALEDLKELKIKKVSKYADHIFALNPDLLYFLPPDKSTFLPYTVAQWYNINPVPYKIDKEINIVHSPTQRACKGSDYVIKAVNNLKKKYPQINLILVENIPNKEAIEIYKKAHIIIDQVLVGWYGAFAVEVMKMGKPVAVFIREEDLKFVPSLMKKDLKESVININPFNMEETLEKYIQDQSLLIEKSKAGEEYVNKWHNPIYIAKLAKERYE